MGTKRSIKFLNLFVVLLMLIGPVMKGATPVSAQDRAGGVVLDGAISSGTADGTATLSIPHTTGSGENRLMLVGISANSYNGARTISSVTFTPTGDSAISLSAVGSIENEAGRLSAIYSLVAPPVSTAGTVTITFLRDRWRMEWLQAWPIFPVLIRLIHWMIS